MPGFAARPFPIMTYRNVLQTRTAVRTVRTPVRIARTKVSHLSILDSLNKA